MELNRDTFWKFAPVWVILFSAGTTLTKSLGQRYLLKREFEFNWSDVGSALLGGVVGYATFRMKHGEKKEQHWYTR